MCISMRFSIGAISGNIRPMLRNDSTSHLRKMAANRLQVVDKLDKRPLIYKEASAIKYCPGLLWVLTSQMPTSRSETGPLSDSGKL